ncbi:U3 small nucleolar RNA-associated protein 15 homolog [Belonocnema kinseyi]|uniref:U3 small nucleolar RNA-associated protein 15 homolog n=1 Tax=Belonocnema kinseyi TaxID=2817044 RepID=UPI00143D8F15|nr:U3 small nucleolar RNA-associated protein 15 homolog [Belonocnema kinseyi]
MATFKKTNIKVFTKAGPELTPDNIYWKKFSAPVLVKEFGPIDYIDFSPAEPYHFAVTCSVRVQVYNPITKLVTKNLSRFKEAAYGGSFRRDGRLLCAGGEEAAVKLFDVGTRSLLRLFSGHRAPVHRTFFTADGIHIASFSDDKTTALWDIPSEKQILKFDEHTDYVRAGAVSPVSPDIFVSGSYDKTVNLYDARTGNKIFTVNHDAPVESVIFLPSGGIVLSAGGTEIRVWDTLTGGKLLAKMSNHHKTITCLTIASHGHKILSGSLDRHVKVYDTGTYKAVHTLDYPNSVLSLGISSNDETIVAGMVDGLISIRRREDDTKDAKQERKKASYRYAGEKLHARSIDVLIREENKQVMGKYDSCLRKFQYSKALDEVMRPYVTNKQPHVTVSLLQELTRRQGLRQALAGREGKSLVTILKFLIRHVGSIRFGRVILHVANVLMDVYEDHLEELSSEPRTMFNLLAKKLDEEEELIMSLTELQGPLQMILSGAEAITSLTTIEPPSLEPSTAAQKNLVLSIA